MKKEEREQKEEVDGLSKEQLNALFDLAEKLPSIFLNRNDPCSCGSGKKYKKCCLRKDKASSSSGVRLETFGIKMDALTSEESMNNFPAPSEEDEEVMSILYRKLHDHPETIDSENCDYFRQLNVLRKNNPDNPVILNYITNGYQLLGLQDKVDELVAETYEKFPDYLFAQVALAGIYLRDGFFEKALEVLKGAYSLKQLYPHRKVFHISEVRAFEHIMVKYFYAKEDVKQAEVHLQIMEKILGEDDPFLRDAQEIIKMTKGIYRLKAGLSSFLRQADKENISEDD